MTAKNVDSPVELMPLIRKVEEAIKRRVAIGTKISYPKLHQEMMQRFENAKAIDHVSISKFHSQYKGNYKHDKEGRVHSYGRQKDPCEKALRFFNI
jgi:hypothetical protein